MNRALIKSFYFRYIPPTDDSDAAKEIAKLTYNINKTEQIPLHINIESIMKNKIKKISSPSHSLKTEIKESVDENGQYKAKSSLEDSTTDVMDRDLVVMIQTEENDKPVVFVEKTPESLAALVSLIPTNGFTLYLCFGSSPCHTCVQ